MLKSAVLCSRRWFHLRTQSAETHEPIARTASTINCTELRITTTERLTRYHLSWLHIAITATTLCTTTRTRSCSAANSLTINTAF